ncbi:MAG: penicillin-binding transpeptidase domain-containing protein, partial [Bacillota bacterium]|nr:penicillin-binding transpeptidase domain-containing protein [Bacillota bacterium]
MSPDHCRHPLRRFVAVTAMCGLLMLLTAACSQDKTSAPTDTDNSTTAATTAEQTTTAAAIMEPAELFDIYARAWEQFDYATMYILLATESRNKIDETAFITRYKNIFQGIEAANLAVNLNETASGTAALGQLDSDTVLLSFSVSMDTLAGPVEINDYQMKLVLEPDGDGQAWKISWSEKLIFPSMDADDKVQARILYPARGEIMDRNGMGLAVNGELIVIGIAPGKFAAVKDVAIPQMAEMLGISEERIAKVFNEAKNPDWFYPVVTLPSDARDLSAKLTAIDGVLYQRTNGRVYPAAAAAGLVIGYIGPITAEELAARSGQGYTATDKTGKMGLEQVYEARLRGARGGEITIVHSESGQLKDVIARKEAVDGESITLALDVTTQISLYDAMKADAGAAAAVNPLTGEILALVSTPSFDPNLLQTYVPDAVQREWNEATKSAFANRFKIGYAPGSVFKLVTAAIGLKVGTLDPDEALPISGKQWQPDASWGNYTVTRVRDIGRPVNLLDALLNSDNIYFAQQALRVGARLYADWAVGFGIGEDLPIDYPFYQSQLSNSGLTSDVLLADTGYGQGEVLLSPLHIALFYSTL